MMACRKGKRSLAEIEWAIDNITQDLCKTRNAAHFTSTERRREQKAALRTLKEIKQQRTASQPHKEGNDT